jgi:BirA family biotin operon repressor/biotin-[acetyl-CoA-carboxylase] ligase
VYEPVEKTLFVGKTIHYLPSCHSTNDLAAHAVRTRSIPEGEVYITDYQTAGRGQRGKTWQSQPGENFMLTLILKPTFLSIDQQFLLSQAVALGVWTYLSSHLADVLIKWPNDLYVGQKKIGGILIENKIQGAGMHYSLVGIGLNINQQHFQELRATSLAHSVGERLALTHELPKLLLALEQHYLRLRSGDYTFIRSHYRSHLLGLDQTRSFCLNDRTTEARLIGVSEQGRLQLATLDNPRIREFEPHEVRWNWD